VISSCKKCSALLPFGKTTKFQYCANCYPDFKREYDRQRRLQNLKKDPDFDRRRDLKKHYGISLEDYEFLFHSQGAKCAICKSTKPKGKGWHIDHDHKSGQIRGILCHYCNLGIGHFKDNERAIRSAIEYLNTWEQNHGQA
jgi:hypothetical protein